MWTLDGSPREGATNWRSEEHTSELQSHSDLVCRLLLEKKKKKSEIQSHSDIVCRLLFAKKEINAELLYDVQLMRAGVVRCTYCVCKISIVCTLDAEST